MKSTTDRPRPVHAGRGRPLRAVPEDISAGGITQMWAEQEFSRLGVTDAPEYGSPAWVKLRKEDPRRYAALLESAELWRRSCARAVWLDQLAEDDPERWFAHVTADADAEAKRLMRLMRLSSSPTWAEIHARRSEHRPAHQLKATPGWPPIAIPGRPGHYLTHGEN